VGKIQQCRNGCGAYITVQEDGGKWKPFDVSEGGEVLDLHNCPNSPYNQQQGGGGIKTGQTTYMKKSFPNPSTTSTTTTTQGGSALDTKRSIQQQGEILQELRELKEFLVQKTIVDTNIYVQQTNQLYNVIAPHLNTTGEKASTLLKKERQSIIDPVGIDHGKKADEYERTKKFVPENGDEEIDDDEDDQKIETED